MLNSKSSKLEQKKRQRNLRHKLNFPKIQKKYKFIKEISRGSYGVVYLAKRLKNHKTSKIQPKTEETEYFAIKLYFPHIRSSIINWELQFLAILHKQPEFLELEEIVIEEPSIFSVSIHLFTNSKLDH